MSASISALWFAAICGFGLVVGLTPLACRAWRALGRPDEEISLRKVHTGEVPRVGGAVIILGFGVALLVGLAGVTELSATHELLSVSPLSGALWGALLAGITGLYDDLVGLRPRTKLAAHAVAAGVAVAFGVQWAALDGLGLLAPMLTWLFLIAAVNAMNFLDGLDGLAGGLALVALGVALVAALTPGTVSLSQAWTAMAAMGAIAGFLVHNRHPARVFMGDAGAYFLGFLAAALLLVAEPVRPRIPLLGVWIPVLALAVPLFDLGLAVVRRSLRGQPLTSGDAGHVHHRLLAAGRSHRDAVRTLWAVAAMFGAVSGLIVVGVGGWWTVLATVVAAALATVLLGYHRLLARLPVFKRRGEVVATLAAIEDLHAGPPDEGPPRWRRLAPQVATALRRVGLVTVEIRQRGATVARAGEGAGAWGWLAIPLPGAFDAELRIALPAGTTPWSPEQVVLIERVVVLLSGAARSTRQPSATGRRGSEPSASEPRAAA